MKWFSWKRIKDLRDKTLAIIRKKKYYIYYFSNRDQINYFLNITKTNIGHRFFWTTSIRSATVFYNKLDALEMIKQMRFDNDLIK